MNFCTGFSTLRAVLRRAGLGQALRVLHYGLIVLAAWAAATVVVRLAGIELYPKVGMPKAGDADSELAQSKGRRAADDAVILRRNLFGAADVDSGDDEAPAAGEADLRLRGIAASQGASFAVFENKASGEQNVFGVGEKVFDGPRLVAVDATGAEVLLRGRKKRYEIYQDEEHATAADASRGKPVKSDKTGREAASGVKKVSENSYLVDRREIENTVANLNTVVTQARAVPVISGGKGAGFKLFGIRSGSIFEKIGLVDGDIVQRVNDTELTDPSKAVGLLEEIQSMDQIRVNFTRDGKQRSHTYTIR